jgi:acetyltransferase-like isoleucine patch superfamily enzyme
MSDKQSILFRLLRKLGHLSRKAYATVSRPMHVLLFKRFGTASYVHLLASVRNHTNIEIGSHTTINRNVTLWPSQLRVGDFVEINPGTVIYGEVTIGDNCMIAPNTVIAGGTHGTARGSVMRLQPSTIQPVEICDDVWIGANATITGGVRIAQGCVIGAGSVVTRSTEPFGIYAGAPAKLIARRQ